MSQWYKQEVPEVLSALAVDAERGLSGEEAARRLKKHGPNELVETGGRGPWVILFEQFKGPMILLLFFAAGISAYLDEPTDAVVILAIVIMNAALGFFQEYRAEKAMAALKQLAVPHVRVKRNGSVQDMTARELVPGDLVLLEAGNLVPADGRLIECQNLKVQEAALTGESVAVEKTTESLSGDDLPVGDRTNSVFMGTIVTYGRGLAVTTDTGMRTELGNIAGLLQLVEDEETPLQRRLAVLGKQLTIAAIVIVAFVFFLGLLQGKDAEQMFLTAISMSVAAVPEGLPAVATVTLALGARRMLKRKALIRRLPAVETLGSVTVICSDKTGTLTENRMVVTELVGGGEEIHRPKAENADEPGGLPTESAPVALMLTVCGLCNDAYLDESKSGEANNSNQVLGDPTETALLEVAARAGLRKPDLERCLPRIAELPFDSERKRMSTVHELRESSHALENGLAKVAQALDDLPETLQQRQVVLTKGAVDELLGVADRQWSNDGITPLDEEGRKRILAANDDLARRGMRVLGMAIRPLSEKDLKAKTDGEASAIDTKGLERNLIFLGMCGMIDPPRAEVADAVARCKSAGIRAVMITGDHPLTAEAIAKELGIGNDRPPITGQKLTNMSSQELSESVKSSAVFARVSPEHKLQIVDALQNQGQIVAMTGDGVNDAPALKRADIGVAMGITGTDVSKEASEMVLLDDNFTTIVNAVEEGRLVADNIRKFMVYAMTGNSGEIWVMLFPAFLSLLSLAMFGDIAIPLLPIQILWINLVTDGLPGLALAMESPERNTMSRPPHPPAESFFARGLGWHIVLFGLLMGIVSFAAGMMYWSPAMSDLSRDAPEVEKFRTIVFMVITLSQMGHVIAIRSLTDSVFRIGLFSNPYMLGAVSLTFVLQFALIYVPSLQRLFHTQALSGGEVLMCVLLSAIVFWSVEAHKWFGRLRERKSAPV